MADSPHSGRLRWVCPGEPSAIVESSFGVVLRELRQRAGVSQRELAHRIGSTQSAIARMEKGGADPRLCTLQKLAEAFQHDLQLHIRASQVD